MKTQSAQHTPGPWTLREGNVPLTINEYYEVFSGCDTVCLIEKIDLELSDVDPIERAEKNRALIAAAPVYHQGIKDLLTAIKCNTNREGKVNLQYIADEIEFLENQIAKSEGRAI